MSLDEDTIFPPHYCRATSIDQTIDRKCMAFQVCNACGAFNAEHQVGGGGRGGMIPVCGSRAFESDPSSPVILFLVRIEPGDPRQCTKRQRRVHKVTGWLTRPLRPGEAPGRNGRHPGALLPALARRPSAPLGLLHSPFRSGDRGVRRGGITPRTMPGSWAQGAGSAAIHTICTGRDSHSTSSRQALVAEFLLSEAMDRPSE